MTPEQRARRRRANRAILRWLFGAVGLILAWVGIYAHAAWVLAVPFLLLSVLAWTLPPTAADGA